MLRSRLSQTWYALACCVLALSFGPAVATDDTSPDAKRGAVAPAPPAAPAVKIDPAVCADTASADCRTLIADDKAERRARIDGLLTRATALVAAHQSARAIADYDAVLKLDPTLTDVRNARGELRRAAGDRPGALADFTAVLKVRPDHEQARENRKSLSKEIEKIGAEMAVGRKAPPADQPAPLK